MKYDRLAQVMVDLTAQGMDLEEVASRAGVSIEECQQRMTDHLEQVASSISVVQMRMIQLRRMEHIIGALWGQVMSGDFATQGRNVKNLIDVIREITELLDLKKDRLRDEQVRLTQAQTLMILDAMGLVQKGMLSGILEWIPEHRHEDFVLWWNEKFPEMAADSVDKKSEAFIQVGQGSGPVELKSGPSSHEGT